MPSTFVIEEMQAMQRDSGLLNTPNTSLTAEATTQAVLSLIKRKNTCLCMSGMNECG